MNKLKKWSIALFALSSLFISYLQPLTVYAEETANVVGGANNTVTFSVTDITSDGRKTISQQTLTIKNGWEIVGRITQNYYGSEIYTESISLFQVKNGECYSIQTNDVNDCTGYESYYDSSGNITGSTAYSVNNICTTFKYRGVTYDGKISCQCSGFKIFTDRESMVAYATTGSLDGMLKDEIDKNWCLKNIGYTVRADDSPTSEAGEDATYIKFTWDIDNLQEGDLLEIKTHSYYKKIGGDQVSGFHDYITYSNHVSAYSGEYELSQYDATKAWFDSLENKPLIFKSYDTDTYYLRPWRNGLAGGWAKVSMSRATPTSTPYIKGIEYGDLDPETGEWEPDDDLTEKNGGGQGIDQNGNKIIPGEENIFTGTNVDNIFAKFFDFMKSLPSMFGDLPALLNQTIGFLPAWVIGAICAAILICIILRIVGR